MKLVAAAEIEASPNILTFTIKENLFRRLSMKGDPDCWN